MPSSLAWVSWWTMLVDVLVVARLTRLVTRDTLPPIRSARDALVKRRTDWSHGWVCAWCVSPWVAVLVIGVHTLVGVTTGIVGGAYIWTLAAGPLAISYAVGFLADRESS